MKIKNMVNSFRQAQRLNKQYLDWNMASQKNVQDNQIPPLSEKEKSEIDSYWGQYGIKYRDYSDFQIYYHVTGIKNPRFIPNGFADCVLSPYYNNRAKAAVWADKNYFSRFLPVVPFPKMLGQKIEGRFYDNVHRCYLAEEISRFCDEVWNECRKDGIECIVIKQTVNSFQGKGVKKYTIHSKEELSAAIEEWRISSGFIIQKAIEQHPFFEQFNASSVNIMRITTWRNGKEILALAPCIRFGIPGSHTDVAYVNGKEIVNCIGIQSDGHIMDHYVTLHGEKGHVNVDNTMVPNWQRILETVKEGHRHLELFGIVAWDVTVDKDGEIICIEYNLMSPGVQTYQFAHGPLAGNNTDDLLDFLTDEGNQKTLLPKEIKMKSGRG